LPRSKSKKGDPKKTLKFLKKHEPITEEEAKKIITEVEEGRKRTVVRKIDFE